MKVRNLVLLGLILGAVLIFYTLSIRQLPFLDSQTTPTVIPPTPNQTVEWELHTDPEMGVSFSYPLDWQKKVQTEKSFELVKWSPHYRLIRIEMYESENQSTARLVAEQNLAKITNGFSEDSFSQTQINPYEKPEVDAVKVTGFPHNLVSAFAMTNGRVSLWITLTEGSDVRGLASDTQVISNDKLLMRQIVDSIDISTQ